MLPPCSAAFLVTNCTTTQQRTQLPSTSFSNHRPPCVISIRAGWEPVSAPQESMARRQSWLTGSCWRRQAHAKSKWSTRPERTAIRLTFHGGRVNHPSLFCLSGDFRLSDCPSGADLQANTFLPLKIGDDSKRSLLAVGFPFGPNICCRVFTCSFVSSASLGNPTVALM